MNVTAPHSRVHSLLSEAARSLAAGQTTKAKKHCEEAVKLAPASADAHMVMADVLAARLETDLARKHYVKATECDQYHFGAWLNYGVFLKEMRERRNAVFAFRNAALIDPKSSLARYNLARALAELGEYRESVEIFETFVGMEPRFAGGFHSLSVVQELDGLYENAIESSLKAIQLDPSHRGCYLQLGGLYQTLGKFDQAEVTLRKGIELSPNETSSYQAMLSLNTWRGTADEDTTLANIRAELERGELELTTRSHFLFAGGKILDRRKEYDEAFEYFAEANAIRTGAIGDRFDNQVDRWNRSVNFFTPKFVSAWALEGNTTEQPIFIVGMPRSGTSLTEQILATHPRVYGAGELIALENAISDTAYTLGETYPEYFAKLSDRELRDHADRYLSRYPEEARDFDRVTDKMPLNLINLGAVALMFPNAKIIHCRRNAVDTCLSNFMQNFMSTIWFSFDQKKLALAYRMHIDAMNHWREVFPGRIFEVRYEGLTSDPEPHIRALLKHCDLEWDDKCLQFHETERGVRTASKWQVRQPMYTSSVEKWRHYEKHLGPLIEGLGDLADS